MPYKRKAYGGLARPSKYQRTAPTRVTYKSVPRLIQKTGSYNKTEEIKFHDVATGSTTLSTTGTDYVGSMVGIAQAITESGRLGRKISLKSIHIRGQLLLASNATMTSAFDRARILVVLDYQSNGATIGTSQVLQTTDIDSFRNLENNSRFKVLMDETYVINASAAAGNGTTNATASSVINFEFHKKLKDIPIEYSGATAAISELRSNNIVIIGISEAGRVALKTHYRTRFVG